MKRTGNRIRARFSTSMVTLALYAFSCGALPASFTFNILGSARAGRESAAKTAPAGCCCCTAASGTAHQCSCCRDGACRCRMSAEDESTFPVLILRAGELLMPGLLFPDSTARRVPVISLRLRMDPDLSIPTPPPKAAPLS